MTDLEDLPDEGGQYTEAKVDESEGDNPAGEGTIAVGLFMTGCLIAAEISGIAADPEVYVLVAFVLGAGTLLRAAEVLRA